jgi:hypothetical protein
MIALSAAGRPALKAISTTAYDAEGYLDVSVARRTWLIAKVLRPFTDGQFEIVVPSRNQADQLQRLLIPARLSRVRAAAAAAASGGAAR